MSDHAMESAKRALDEGWKRATEALKHGDVEAMVSLFTDDATLIDPTMGTVFGKAKLRETYTGAFASTRFTDMTRDQQELSVSGDYAVEDGVFTQYVEDGKGGPPQAVTQRYLMVWQRVGEAWLVLRDAAIPFPPDSGS